MDTKILMEKIAEVAPEAHRILFESAEELKGSPFGDEVVEELDAMFQKTAANWGLPGAIATGVGTAVVSGIALNLAGDAMEAVRRGLTKTRNYRSMLRENPDLQKHPMGAKAVQQIFSTLHRFNPEFAGDPLVSGTFVRNHLNSAGAENKQVDLGTLTSLVNARKSLTEARTKPFSAVMDKPFGQGMMIGGDLSGLRKQVSDLKRGGNP